MSIISVFVTHAPSRVIHNRIASVKPREALFEDGGKTVPSTVPVPDQPKGKSKGNQIFIREKVWRFLEKINTAAAYQSLRNVSIAWINNTDWDEDTPYSTAKAESLTFAFNIVELEGPTTPSHVKLVSWPSNFDFSQLDEHEWNWRKYPTRFMVGTSLSRTQQIQKLGGLDQYITFLHRVEKVAGWTPQGAWMHRDDLELWPISPNGYIFDGLDVYDGERNPLMTTNQHGERSYHTDWFHLETPGIIPPVGWR